MEHQKNLITLDVVQGHVEQEEIAYETHRRGTNWMATVEFSPSAPGNLDRAFWERGSGSYCEVPAALQEGSIIEVAHDYTTGGDNRRRRRSYFRVHRVGDIMLHVEETKKPGRETLTAGQWVSGGGQADASEFSLGGLTDEELLAEVERRGLNSFFWATR